MSNTQHSPTRSARVAGGGCVAGALLLGALGFDTQVVQASSLVPHDQWSYPWESGTWITVALFGAAAQLLVTFGLVALSRRGVAGTSRAARLGLAAAVAGGTMLTVAQLAAIAVREQTIHETWPKVIGGVLAIATLLVGIGLFAAGRGVLRAGVWRDWRRFTLLVPGFATAAFLVLQNTGAFPSALGVYGLSFAGLGIALAVRPERRASAQVQTA